eukprot:CAMPEP_0202017058 /NCGR_PEP_ID=MMETSP0905-20130828/36082_1 /ASSEMBLY_ACC=CAM_ASM_000554 /TAXON_ID=420261 /ORGANISM="Thalassiosira antarctica, Strain CCMP982" /LENGTH=44 /DNA_ID= /DNA_START= /DNA_END= /DNA_ORIENTATION=
MEEEMGGERLNLAMVDVVCGGWGGGGGCLLVLSLGVVGGGGGFV